VLAVDAFSSDSIPVHLLTRQAIELYARCLGDDGVVAVHISNRFLDLKPVLAGIAAHLHLAARLVRDDPDDEAIRASGRHDSSSDWVLIARRAGALEAEPFAGRAEALAPQPGLRVWTDQSSDLLGIVKSRPARALRDLFGG
jgi:hypothetical protein